MSLVLLSLVLPSLKIENSEEQYTQSYVCHCCYPPYG